jgi:hypothetical protein
MTSKSWKVCANKLSSVALTYGAALCMQTVTLTTGSDMIGFAHGNVGHFDAQIANA